MILVYIFHIFVISFIFIGCPRDVMVNALDCGLVVSEFELQSRFDVHFRTNIRGKGINTKVDMPLKTQTKLYSFHNIIL